MAPRPGVGGEPLDMLDVLDVLVVGAGFSGLTMLLKARTLGLRALAVDSAPSVGGTWYHNRYPGARVDIQSLEYSFSFSEELQQAWQWSERYASQPELLRYANHVADRFGLREGIRLSTRLTAAHWDERERLWHATLREGEQATRRMKVVKARFIVMASGPLSTPNTPEIPGLATFAGRVLHTANWPHEPARPSEGLVPERAARRHSSSPARPPEGPMPEREARRRSSDPIDFAGQHVGVVGTGSSGVQVIPQLAKQARRVTVFQRTPAYVVPAHNGPLDPEWERRVKADYAGFRERSRAMPGGFGSEHPPHRVSALAAGDEERAERFEARWRIGGFAFLGTFFDILLDLRANALAAEFVRGKIRSIVRDAAVAERLSPRYPIGCKRLCVDAQGYYETFNEPHVELVDVGAGGAPIERITPAGLVTADGHEFKLDALVLATGFDAVTGTLTRLPLCGRGGLTMADKWSSGPHNYLGLMTAGFPNLFHVASAGSTAAFTSVILSLEHHVDWIGQCITWLDANGHATIEASEEAEAAWMARTLAMAQQTVFLECNSWYLGANIPGKARVFMALVGGFPAYAKRCADVAANGYEGFRIG